jgi:hypothetical protein
VEEGTTNYPVVELVPTIRGGKKGERRKQYPHMPDHRRHNQAEESRYPEMEAAEQTEKSDHITGIYPV